MYLIIILIFLSGVFIVIKRTKSQGILNISLWIFIAYSFLIITHLFSGIYYYSCNFLKILPYVFLCLFLLLIGDKIGAKIKSLSAKTLKVSLTKLCIFSFIGSILYLFDLLRLNEIKFGLRIQDYNVSIIGVIGNLIAGLGIIGWLISIYEYRINRSKIPFLSYLALIAYVIGGIATAGRQAVIIISIATIVLFIWSSKKRKENTSAFSTNYIEKKTHKPWGIIILVIIFLSYFIFISAVRTQIFKIDHKISMLENVFNFKTSDKVIKDAHKLGFFADVYIETLVYYSHELVHLSIMYQYYDHNPLFGLSELHYLERRLQWLLGKPGEISLKQVESAIDSKGRFFSHTWGTFITNFIIDFGRFGTAIACLIVGILIGIFYRKFKSEENSLTVVRQVLICAGIVFSIQFSPFAELNWTFPLVVSSFLRVIPKNYNTDPNPIS